MNGYVLKKEYNSTNETEKNYVKINSWLVSLMISFNLINALANKIIPSSLSVGNLVAITITLLYFISLLFQKNRNVKVTGMIFMIYIFIVLILSYSRLLYDTTVLEKIINFLFFGLISFSVGLRSVNVEYILRNLIYISLISIFFLDEVFGEQLIVSEYIRIDMGLSYVLLPVVCGAILHFNYYRNKRSLIIKIGYIFNLILLFLLVFLGSRGVVISISVLFFLCFITKFKERNMNVILVKKNIKIFLLLVLLLLVFLSLENILLFLNSLTQQFNINISFLEKSMNLLRENNDISNGRVMFYQQAIRGIKQSPLWGNGVGSFFLNTGLVYPHNLILEILYDGGILLFLPIFIPLIIVCKRFLNGGLSYKENYILFILLISISIPRLMLSSSIWINQDFWLLLGFIFSEIEL